MFNREEDEKKSPELVTVYKQIMTKAFIAVWCFVNILHRSKQLSDKSYIIVQKLEKFIEKAIVFRFKKIVTIKKF